MGVVGTPRLWLTLRPVNSNAPPGDADLLKLDFGSRGLERLLRDELRWRWRELERRDPLERREDRPERPSERCDRPPPDPAAAPEPVPGRLPW